MADKSIRELERDLLVIDLTPNNRFNQIELRAECAFEGRRFGLSVQVNAQGEAFHRSTEYQKTAGNWMTPLEVSSVGLEKRSGEGTPEYEAFEMLAEKSRRNL